MNPDATPNRRISERRVEALIEAYGSDPARWPVHERADALALVAVRPELSAAIEEAAALDGLLDTLPAPAPSPAFRVALKEIPDRRHSIDWPSILWPFGAPWRPAMGLATSLAVGLMLGISLPASIDTQQEATVLSQDQITDSDPMTLAGLGAFGGAADDGVGLAGYPTERQAGSDL